jgi:O-antigen/teichoic acid export membrane protein
MMALIDLLGEITRGFGRALPYVVFRNLVPPLGTMGVLIWLWLSRGQASGVAYAQLCGLGLGVVAAIGFVVQMVRTRIGPVWPIFQLRLLYGYAVPIVLNTMVSLAMIWTDLFLLGLLTNAGTVGVYRGCMQITLLFDLIWNAFSSATATLYTVLIADQRREQLQEIYTVAGRLITMVSLPLLLVIMVNGGDILGLLGPAFVAGALPLFILASGHFVKLAFGAASVVLNVGGRQSLEAGNVALAAGMNLILNLILIPIFGLLGAALATAISLIALALLRCVQVRRVLGLHTVDVALLRILLITLPLALAIWAASAIIGFGPGSGLVALLLRLIAMGAVIGAALWFFGLKADDRAMLLNLALHRGGSAAVAGSESGGD